MPNGIGKYFLQMRKLPEASFDFLSAEVFILHCLLTHACTPDRFGALWRACKRTSNVAHVPRCDLRSDPTSEDGLLVVKSKLPLAVVIAIIGAMVSWTAPCDRDCFQSISQFVVWTKVPRLDTTCYSRAFLRSPSIDNMALHFFGSRGSQQQASAEIERPLKGSDDFVRGRNFIFEVSLEGG